MNLFTELISNLKELLECPISNQRIKIPTITPSGITIDESEMDKIIQKNIAGQMKDPFNSDKECKTKIYNLFAKRVLTLYKEFKKKKNALLEQNDDQEIKFLKV